MSSIDIPSHIAENFFMATVDLATRRGDTYNGRCPICGDSTKNSRKRRLYMLYDHSKGYRFYCHNDDCEVNHNFIGFVKEYYPSTWDEIKIDLFDNLGDMLSNGSGGGTLLSSGGEGNPKSKKRKKRMVNGIPIEYDPDLTDFIKRCCVKLTSKKYPHLNSVIAKARDYLENRKIPKDKIESAYICYTNDDEKEWYKYIDRVIIPFYDDDFEIYYFQGRDLKPNSDYKYINWTPKKIEGKEDEYVAMDKPIYNGAFIDKTKPVLACEGLMDSFFVTNGCSVLGAKFTEDRLEMYKDQLGENIIWILDNDKAGINKMQWLFERGQTCFIMPEKYKKPSKRLGGSIPKDLNDFSIATRKPDLTSFIIKYSYTGVEGAVQLNIGALNHV
jgi:hypothetical protein